MLKHFSLKFETLFFNDFLELKNSLTASTSLNFVAPCKSIVKANETISPSSERKNPNKKSCEHKHSSDLIKLVTEDAKK